MLSVLVLLAIIHVLSAKTQQAHQKRSKLLDYSEWSDLPDAANPCNFVLFKQCNSKWGDEMLGFSTTNSICAAGCAESSTSMVVKTWGDDYNPGTLNTWLKDNGGYESADLLVWSATDKLDAKFIKEDHINESDLEKHIKNCSNAFIANVLNGEHWVLLTAYDGNGNFYVNDPGFSTTTYAYSGMGDIVKYERKK